MFTAIPAYPRYRTLHLTDPLMRGEDCYALQTALRACDCDPGPVDGILGRGTSAAIREAQTLFLLVVDGLAGGRTQEALARAIAGDVQGRYSLPAGLLRGQLAHESSMRLGNYSPARPDGSYDAGVAEFNTAHTPAQKGFDVPWSIDALGRVVRDHYDLFKGVPGRRRWLLAQGAHNAPAFACYLANEEGASVSTSRTARPTPLARATFESYMQSVSAFLAQ